MLAVKISLVINDSEYRYTMRLRSLKYLELNLLHTPNLQSIILIALIWYKIIDIFKVIKLKHNKVCINIVRLMSHNLNLTHDDLYIE